MNPARSIRVLVFSVLTAGALLMQAGCRSYIYKEGERYPWRGPLTDGTNGIVQPPKW